MATTAVYARNRSVNRQLDMLEEFVDFGAGVALIGLFNQLAFQMWREQLDEFVHEPAQESAATESDFGDARRKQMAGIESNQIAVELRLIGHMGDDADTQAETHIGFRSEEHTSEL